MLLSLLTVDDFIMKPTPDKCHLSLLLPILSENLDLQSLPHWEQWYQFQVWLALLPQGLSTPQGRQSFLNPSSCTYSSINSHVWFSYSFIAPCNKVTQWQQWANWMSLRKVGLMPSFLGTSPYGATLPLKSAAWSLGVAVRQFYCLCQQLNDQYSGLLACSIETATCSCIFHLLFCPFPITKALFSCLH